MSELAAVDLKPLDQSALASTREIEAALAGMPQLDLRTDHLLHAGMYARTLHMPAGAVVTGALTTCDTVLVIQGHCWLHTGQDAIEINGYRVLSGLAGRKSICRTITDTKATMLFPTKATSVAQAEAEFTDEADRLMSRRSLEVKP
ncbi:MAG: hypothetical protein U5L08_04375 [Xanthomonadales bacterium]|nr:hypothetical protein [Xanthomonadales bacterium]